MTATTTNNAANNTNTTSTRAEYFNLNVEASRFFGDLGQLKPSLAASSAW